MAFTLFFIAQKTSWPDGEGGTIEGFELGPSDQKVPLAAVVVLKHVANTYLFSAVVGPALASEIVTTPWDEFRATGHQMNAYVDFAMRIALGLSGGTLAELKYMIGARWFVGGEWYSGDVHAWETAGSPADVMFGPGRQILGQQLVGIE